MADDQVIVEFGAKIDALVEGVNEVNSKLDSVGEHGEKLSAGFERLKHILEAVFSIEAITAFVEKMGELGLQTERVMATLGVTAEEAGQLGGLAKLTGSSLEGLSLSLERMSLNVQRSTKDAFTPQAQAMQVLGLNAKQLIGIPTAEYVEKLHDAVSQFNPSLNLTNAIMAVGGRGIAQMIPLLQLSGDKWKEMKAQITAAQDGLAAAIPGMADTHVKLTLLGMSTESLGARIFTVLKPAIDLVITSMTTWIQKLDSKTIQEFAKTLVDVLGTAVIKLIGLFYEFGGTVDGLLQKMKLLLTGAAIGGAVGLLGGGAGALLGALGGAGLAAAFGSWMEQYDSGADKAKADVDKQKNELVARVQAMMKAIQDAISGGGGQGEHGPAGAAAAAINEKARQQFDATIASIQGQNTLWAGWLAQQKVIYQNAADTWTITEQQKLSMTRSATQQQFDAELANLNRIKSLYQSAGLDKEAEQTNQKILQLQQSFATEMIRINGDMVRNMKSKFDDVFNSLQSSFNGQLRGLLAGTTTWGQAFKSVLGDMLIYFIQLVEKMVFQWIAGKLAMAAVDKSSAATQVATDIGAQEATLPARVAKFTSDITADAALVFAGIFANLAPLLGPAAAGPAEAGSATVLAGLGAIPKFELGTDYVPRTGLAVVHQGERIITAGDNAKGAGGGSNSFQITAWDGASVARWLSSGGAEMMAKAVSKAMVTNRSLRPAY